ncbi:MAG TPA: hypothetical protein VK607_11560 [Kofleriaceae bacterium]|nr:hypothetical protein [Kofleriaceae bacterium]
MFATRVYHYRQPAAVILGLKELRRQGLTPRGMLFLALDPRGEAYLVVPEDLDAVESIRVGDKLALVSPLEGRYFHFDSVHRLPGDHVLWNGDRRLSDTGSAPEVAVAVSSWLKSSSAKNVFLGCTSHVPGSWWTVDQRSPVADLHTLGFLDCVVATHGILARKIDDPRLFLLGFTALAQQGHPGTGWSEVFTSDLGNILMIERRVLHYRIVLTCERGLLEIDISHLPDLVIETARVPMRSGFGVVGRVDNGAFAVTTGTIEPWGLTNMGPAILVGSPIPSLLELPRMLKALPVDPAAGPAPAAEPDSDVDPDA